MFKPGDRVFNRYRPQSRATVISVAAAQDWSRGTYTILHAWQKRMKYRDNEVIWVIYDHNQSLDLLDIVTMTLLPSSELAKMEEK